MCVCARVSVCVCMCKSKQMFISMRVYPDTRVHITADLSPDSGGSWRLWRVECPESPAAANTKRRKPASFLPLYIYSENTQ